MKQYTVVTACILLCLLALESEAHPRGHHGRRNINSFIRALERFGICDAYNNATEDEQATCSEEFVNGLRPNNGRGNGRGRDIVDFICLEGGVTASSACEILNVACESGTNSTLEICSRRRGNRQRRDDSDESVESGEEEQEEEEEEEAEEADGDGGEEDTGTATTASSGAGTTSAVTAAPAATGTAPAVTTPAGTPVPTP